MPTGVVNYGGVEGGGLFVGKKVVFKAVGNKAEVKNPFENIYNYSDESSSSIGKNSDISMEKSGEGEEEVQSSLQALEEVLPIRRGISSFYNGKSKSYTSLAKVSSSFSSSVKDIAKPDNPYTRNRRNLLSCNLNSCLKGGISKKSKALALGFAMANDKDGECNSSADSSSFSRSFSSAESQRRASVTKT